MVECVRLETDMFELRDVVGGLVDPPTVRAATRPAQRRAGEPDATVAGLARVVREAAVGERNNRLNWAAYCAGKHIAAGVFSSADAEDALLAAALHAGLPEAEALRTICSGLEAKRAA